jgi:GTP-binding protein Era
VKSGFVAIVGRPNSGKSTLINHVLGQTLSIVTPKAQTTRERVLGILTEKEGQIIFIDTPGIHKAREGGINEYMVNEAREALDSPSCVWYIVDPRSKVEHEMAVIDLLKHTKVPIFLLMNKSDLFGKSVPDTQVEELEKGLKAAMDTFKLEVIETVRIAAQGGVGVAELLFKTWTVMPEGPLYYEDPEQLSDRPTRFFISEKIREQLYLSLGEELPYSCGVEIEKYDEKAKPLRIEAVIYVERDSQKGMVVGKGGAKIKEIGTNARKTIEEFLGEKVFLGLKVELLKDWTRNVAAMERMGYRKSR